MPPLRVLVVDDAAIYRKIVADALRDLPDVEVVGTAVDGLLALEKLDGLRPDLITLDLEMPRLDGLATLAALRERKPRPGVLMVSAFTSTQAGATARALAEGAFDFVLKPTDGDFFTNAATLRLQLAEKIAAFRESLGRADAKPSAHPFVPRTSVDFCSQFVPVRPPLVCVVGISTGGPEALARMLPRLPAELAAPLLIVQHMPPLFTKSLADDLNRRCRIRVIEGLDGEIARPGEVIIAPGGRQMKIVRHGDQIVIRTTYDPPENCCRPAVDYLFRSAARAFACRAVGVIMTGMGSDGTLGCRQLKQQGATVIAQDKASCVVFGMPAQPIQEGLADIVAPPDEIADHITRLVGKETLLCK